MKLKIKDMTPDQKKEYYRNYYAKNTDKYKARNAKRVHKYVKKERVEPRYINVLQAKVKELEELKLKEEEIRKKEEEIRKKEEEIRKKEEERLKLEYDNLRKQQQKLNYIQHIKNQLPNIVF